jgi:hypothetical protein
MDLRFGFERLKEPGEKTGWLINMHPVSTCTLVDPLLLSRAGGLHLSIGQSVSEEQVTSKEGTCCLGDLLVQNCPLLFNITEGHKEATVTKLR